MLSIMILYKIVLACFWFSIGIFFYSRILQGSLFKNTKIKFIIDSLSFVQLSLIIFAVYLIINLIITLFFDYYISGFLESINTSHLFFGDSSASPTSATSSLSGNSATSATPSDGGIMAIAVAGGLKLAQTQPTVAGKLVAATSGIALGGAAILVKNVSANVSKNLGKPNSYTDLNDFLSDMFHLTGNSVLDLLTLLQFFQKIQLFFLFLISYNSILFLINEDKLELLLSKLLPTPIINYIIKSLRLFKKTGILLIIILFFLLIISNLYSYYYLNFFVSNLDGIIDLYISTKK